MMDLEQNVAFLVSRIEELEQENKQLKEVLNFKKENSDLGEWMMMRRRMCRSSEGSVEKQPEKSFHSSVGSASVTQPSCHMRSRPCDERQFRDDLQRPKNQQEPRTSSPVDFKSFLQSSMHTEAAESSHQWVDNPPDLRDPSRLLGEMAFQLDQRILAFVFQGHRRLYGFSLLNIPEKITEVSTNPLTGAVDDGYRRFLTHRHVGVMSDLAALGYESAYHPHFSEIIVNSFGILRERPEAHSSQMMLYNSADFLQKVVMTSSPRVMQEDLLLVLNCLCAMACKDGKPLLVW